jgi:hypothetical protein
MPATAPQNAARAHDSAKTKCRSMPRCEREQRALSAARIWMPIGDRAGRRTVR